MIVDNGTWGITVDVLTENYQVEDNGTWGITVDVLTENYNVYVDDNAIGGWYDSNHVATVNEALLNISESGIIHVFDGIYDESLNVTKSISIIGNGTENTFIVCSSDYNITLNISADNVLISQLNITNAVDVDFSDLGYIGVIDIKSENVTINNCNISSGKGDGINANNSHNLSIHNCTVFSNYDDGIQLVTCRDCLIADNEIKNHVFYPSTSSGIYLAGFQETGNTKNIILKNNTLMGNDVNIQLVNTDNSTIYNNYFGDYVDDLLVINSGVENISWNISKTSGINILGGTNIGGNYWIDYDGVDYDGDKIGDTDVPFTDGSNISGDYYPLTNNFSYKYSISDYGTWGITVDVDDGLYDYHVDKDGTWGITVYTEYYIYTPYCPSWLMWDNGSSPVVVKNNASIIDGSTNISESIEDFSCYIYDPSGDEMNWTIETSPDIGNSSGTTYNGTINTSISFSSGNNLYVIFVNVSDSVYYDNETFTFYSEASASDVWTFNATNVNITNAILRGYLNDTGGMNCTVWFEYGTTLSYGNLTQTQQMNSTGDFNTTSGTYAMTLRPDGAGDITGIAYEEPVSTAHYLLVDDATQDGMVTIVYEVPSTWTGHPYANDLYSIDIDSYNDSYAIHNVTVHALVYGSTGNHRFYKTLLRTDSDTFFGTIMTPGTENWYDINTKYETNPYTKETWNWSSIADIQAGVSLTGEHNENGICTQVYVVVNYSTDVVMLNLEPGTLYHLRTVSNNENGTVYGNHRTFITLSGAVDNFTASNYNTSVINITWDETEGVDSLYIVYAKDNIPGSKATGIFLVNTSSVSYNHTGLDYGTHYYYRAYVWNDTTGFGGNVLDDAYTNPQQPVSITDVGSGLTTIDVQWYGGTNATNTVIYRNISGQSGYPSRFNGYECANKTNIPTPTIDTIGGLVQDTMYNFSAYSFNPDSGLYSETNATFNASTSAEAGQPSAFVVYAHNHTVMNLSWIKSDPTHDTIIVRKTGSYPADVDDGTQIYNGSASAYQDTGLTPASIYFYRAWGYFIDVSSGYASATNYTLPEPPQNLTGTLTGTTLDIDWDIGQGATSTVLSMNLTGYQNDPNHDDTFYNGTSNVSYISGVNDLNFVSGWSYVEINGDDVYSIITYLRWGGLELNVFKETNPTIHIENYTVFITNEQGTETYYNTSGNNPFRISVDDVPNGQNIHIQISKDGYKTQTQVWDLYDNYWYAINFYLPPDESGGGDPSGGDYIPPTTEDILQTTTEDIDDYLTDETVTLNCEPKRIVGVYVWNASIYGGWVEVDDTLYTVTGNYLTVNPSAMDENSTKLKVNYYCWSTESYASHYVIDVKNEYNEALEGAKITISRYINTSAQYEPVLIELSDADGQIDCWLIPGTLYKVKITKTYYTTVYDEWEPPDIIYTEDIYKTFRMELDEGSMPDSEKLFDNIIWSIEPTQYYFNNSFTVWFNITSTDNKIEYFSMGVYEYNATYFNWSLLYSNNLTTSSGGSISYTFTNSTGKYSVVCTFKKVNFSEYTFGIEDGCRMYYIYWNNLQETVSDIPKLIYLVISVTISILAMGFLYKFGAGSKVGIAGLIIMGIFFALKPDMVFSGVSIWIIYVATWLVYGFLMFLMSRGSNR